jgi:hypothetical protein
MSQFYMCNPFLLGVVYGYGVCGVGNVSYLVLCLLLLRDLSFDVGVSLSVLSFFRRLGLNWGDGSCVSPSDIGGSFVIWCWGL